MKSATLIGGSSHPDLVALIASRLGVTPAPVSLKRFANGETSVVIHQSVRDQDVFIIQSGSKTVNDSLMELLILISACKGGSARRITAVMPYFPYSKQSKMKKYRDAITARMVANLLSVAGVDHVITMDLHASQMQGFFTRPVDNLYAEPNIAEWIRHNVEDWENAVVVSKKPGGAKRVTSLADTLNLDFALINTDKQRSSHLQHSTFMEESFMEESQMEELTIAAPQSHMGRRRVHTSRFIFGHVVDEEFEVDSSRPETPRSECLPSGTMTPIPDETPIYDDDEEEELNAASASICTERMITLVGDVNGKTALLLDDMVENPTTFVVAAEHMIKRCGAKRVIIIGTHGIFQNNCLAILHACPFIDKIVVTNTYPLDREAIEIYHKLVIVDISGAIAEAIRRTHNGESISFLFKKAF